MGPSSNVHALSTVVVHLRFISWLSHGRNSAGSPLKTRCPTILLRLGVQSLPVGSSYIVSSRCFSGRVIQILTTPRACEACLARRVPALQTPDFGLGLVCCAVLLGFLCFDGARACKASKND